MTLHLLNQFRVLFIFLLSFGYSIVLCGQSNYDGIYSTAKDTNDTIESHDNPNDTVLGQSFYISGSTLLFLNSIDVSYEWLFNNKNKPTNYRGVSASFGAFAIITPSLGSGTSSSSDNGIYLEPRYVFLRKKNSNKYFEFNIGAVMGYEFSGGSGNARFIAFPDVALGYRKITKEHNVFRIGFSLIKGFYLSFGSLN